MNDLTTSAFITPPTLEALEERLRARCTDDESVILKRLENATSEIRAVGEYDFTIVNGTVKKAAKQFVIVAKAARLKQSREDEEKFIVQWLGEK
jgi:guanylate kinase